MYYYNLVVQHRFIRALRLDPQRQLSVARPPYTGEPSVRAEKEQALRGEKSDMLEAAVSGGGRGNRGRRGRSYNVWLLRHFLDAAVSAATVERLGMGDTGAGRLQLRHHAGENDGQSGGRCERADISGRSSEEVGAGKKFSRSMNLGSGNLDQLV